jgi:hypothetical protein
MPRFSAIPAVITLAWVASGSAEAQSSNLRSEVMQVDEAYRIAKLKQDLPALNRILADGFNETNQNGNSRNKAETLDLWKSFSISSLTTDRYDIDVAGNTVVVRGCQTENSSERMLFARTYVKRNGWQLLTSMQYRDGCSGLVPRNLDPQASEVLQVDEAYRLGKLRRDIQGLDRVLADAFTETNQNGNTRNKAETLELWKSFSISSLTTDSAEVRINGDTAVVIGTQTENGPEHMLFTRVYVKTGDTWKLLSSFQYRDPRRAEVASR